MPSDTPNLEQAEYVEIPFTPYVAPKRRPSVDDEDDNDYLFRDPNYFVRAVGGGVLGALLGAAVYAAFVGFTGWTIGYLAVLVGFLVGKGMMIASQDLGGESYQFTAVALTYLSVGAAQMGLQWWFVERFRPVAFDLPRALGLARVGLIYPVLDIISSPAGGVIGLIILYVGLRAAWRMTSANPVKRSPFRR